MFDKVCLPNAPVLVESMRSIGYDFNSAIADVIDNSVTAQATRIDIIYEEDKERIIIFDNGYGMTNLELENAMRYGSKNPNDLRSKEDLGRFGLGLKSASLSQCRKLTVVSKKDEELSAYIWDIDNIISKNNWSLIGLHEDEIIELIKETTLLSGISKKLSSFTLVYWENFDKLSEQTTNLKGLLATALNDVQDHLALVFHRYLEEGLEIYVNNDQLLKRDPFLKNNKKTQKQRKKIVKLEGSVIEITPFVLPHMNELTKKDIQLLGKKDSMRTEQGFYIYRQKRLIIYGTWFRLESKNELSKSARVQVDIPNTLDYMWNIDVKKSTAVLPEKIRKSLIGAISESRDKSDTIYNYRGRKEDVFGFSLWNKIQGRDQNVFYEINRNYPQLKILETMLNKEGLRILSDFIDNIELSLPVESIYYDAAKGRLEINNEEREKTINEISLNLKYCIEHNIDYKPIIHAYLSIHKNDDELVNLIKKEVAQYEQ